MQCTTADMYTHLLMASWQKIGGQAVSKDNKTLVTTTQHTIEMQCVINNIPHTRPLLATTNNIHFVGY